MKDPRQVRTGRLRLEAVTADDLDSLFELHANPEVWRHFPSGRHTTKEQTGRFIADKQAEWTRGALGYWTAWSVSDVNDGPRLGQFVGIGGCARRGDALWNLYYRLSPSAWGHGFATEIAVAGKSAAAGVDPELPVVASLLEHNASSRRTSERVGLRLAWRGPDRGNPDHMAIRLIYADRPLKETLIADLTSAA